MGTLTFPRTLAAVVVAAAMALTGCTNASDSSTTGAGSASGSASTPSNKALIDSIQKDDAIAKLVPASIASKGTITIGTDASYAPAEFIDADGKTIIGYDVDYAKAMGKLMGVNVTFTNATFDTLIPAVGPKYDMSVASFTITSEREKQVNLVSYFTAGMAKAVLKGNPKKVPADSLCGVTVAVETGTSEEADAQKQSTACKASGKKETNVLSYKAQTDATTNVIGGKADVTYADSMIIAYAIEQTNGALEQLGGITDAEPFGVVTAKNDGGLSKAVQAATQKLIDDGTMKKILATWGNESGMIAKSEINPAVK
ncbi:ABC transporter substrate-binding protein [Acidipropionibacterium jensenii]|uniref:ABC transporter substrate-binding protein n=1 Tax=Acidipropionibacterium jensenii TaxID=1749 RepID=UPI000BC342B4|nr:ABC transporter substrate-binding protein [Acidipropionibacterium jensenii]AZZ41683.1 ABC transporter substrate-binding protein [Acidipropionibacterium jensenii]